MTTEEGPNIGSLHLNPAGLQAQYLVQLQRLLDTVAFCFAGAGVVDEEAYNEFRPFYVFHPAQDNRLTRDAAANEAERWLIRNSVRDAIEITNVFLEECRIVCALLATARSGTIRGEEFNRILQTEKKRYHDLGLPLKLKEIRDVFGVQSDFDRHLLSLNQARACLVHRLGVVSDKMSMRMAN